MRRTLLVATAVLLLAAVQCVVDRTYFNYLGTFSIIKGLKITASPEDVQRAYAEKKEKLSALPSEDER